MESSKHEERIGRFNKIKYPKNKKKFEYILEIREGDLYGGAEVDCALEIMEVVDEFYEKLQKTIDDQNHSGWSLGLTKALVHTFYKNSPKGLDQIY